MDWRLVCVLLVLAASCLTMAESSSNGTSTIPDKHGMGSLFSMTNGFIDLVMSKKHIIEELNNNTGGNLFVNVSSSQRNAAIQEIAKGTLIGYVICIALGTVFIVVMPVVGWCFCCCRCCGNCGGKPQNVDKGPDRLKKMCFSIFFIIIVTFMLGSVVCIFVNNAMIRDQTSESSSNNILKKAIVNVNKTEDYINNVIVEFTDAVTKGFNSTVENVTTTLESAAIDAKNMLAEATDASSALENVKKLAEDLKNVNESLTRVNETTIALKDGTASLADSLSQANQNLTSILQSCFLQECNATRSMSENALKLDVNFTQVDDVSSKLGTVTTVNSDELLSRIQDGDDSMKQITEEIGNQTATATEDVKKNINIVTRSKIMDKLHKSIETIRDELVNFTNARSKINDQKKKVNDYGNYVYYAGVALGCITLLIVVLYFLGLLYVTCCGSSGSSCNQNTGTNFLMAGVGFTFIFATYLMLLTTVLFIVGAPAYAVFCRYASDLSNPELTQEFDRFLAVAKINLEEYNVTISKVMEKCSKDESLYNAVNLGSRIDIVQYLDVKKYPTLTKTIDELKNKTFDFGEVNILNNDTRSKLNDLIDGTLDSIDFGSFTDQVKRNVTNGSLTDLATEIKATADKLNETFPFNMTDAPAQLQQLATRLDAIQAQEVNDLEKKKTDLSNAIRELEKKLKENGGFTNHTKKLLSSLEDAEHNIKENSSTLVQQIVGNIADKILNSIIDNLNNMANELTNNVGRCKEPLDIIQSLLDIGCILVVGPFNALWFSLGWFVFFSVFGIVFAVKLVGVYQAVEMDDGNDTKNFDEANFDRYANSNAVNNTHSGGGYANDGFNNDNYNSKSNHRSSRDRRQHRQHREHRHHSEHREHQHRYSDQQYPPHQQPHHYQNRGHY